MKLPTIFSGLLPRGKAAVGPTNLAPVMWSDVNPVVPESFAGAWQRGLRGRKEDVLAFGPVYACVTRIANDISKMDFRLVEEDRNGVTREIESAAFSPVLRKPSSYQRTQKKFIEQWMISKLLHGNTYVLKTRDERNVVTGLYILDPMRVDVLVAPGPSIFYRLRNDSLSPEETADAVVPQSAIIHDRMNCLFHPLIGVPPITACYAAAAQGIAIQRAATKFFQNNAQPGGILTAPGVISEATAERLRKMWEEKFGGNNQGRLAVFGDGMKFERMSVNPVDAQLIEQLKVTGLQVCTVYHVPPFKVSLGDAPTYQNAAVLNQIYYSDCLQTHIEDIEDALDEGLNLPSGYCIEADLDALLRMDAATLMTMLKEGVGGGILAPNEARARVNLAPVKGGNSPFLQQQMWSLQDLANRADIPGLTPPAPAALPAPKPPAPADDDQTLSLEDISVSWRALLTHELRAA